MEYEGVNGGTGQQFQTSKHDGTDAVQQYLKPDATPDFCHPLTGVRVGSRVAILFPAQLAHAGAGVPSLGVGPNDSIVFVIDVLDAALPHALGATGAPQSGFPAISIDPATGTPGFTFANSEPPTELKTEKLIIGNGEKVKEGDTVTLNYSGIIYGGQATFDSSWDQGQPAQFELVKGGLIEGFYQTLVGSSVGDRIVTIIPPALGYGANDTTTIPANSTLVFVIEVLGTKHK
jgi:peptidylprolyl isomerase